VLRPLLSQYIDQWFVTDYILLMIWELLATVLEIIEIIHWLIQFIVHCWLLMIDYLLNSICRLFIYFTLLTIHYLLLMVYYWLLYDYDRFANRNNITSDWGIDIPTSHWSSSLIWPGGIVFFVLRADGRFFVGQGRVSGYTCGLKCWIM